MQLTFALLADYANQTPEQKLNVLGIFNRIFAKAFPASHPQMFLCMRFSASPAEYGSKRTITVKLLSADAEQLLETAYEMEIPSLAGQRVDVNYNLAMNGAVFPKADEYQFSILVDGDEKGTVPLSVVLLEE